MLRSPNSGSAVCINSDRLKKKMRPSLFEHLSISEFILHVATPLCPSAIRKRTSCDPSSLRSAQSSGRNAELRTAGQPFAVTPSLVLMPGHNYKQQVLNSLKTPSEGRSSLAPRVQMTIKGSTPTVGPRRLWPGVFFLSHAHAPELHDR